MTCSNEFIKKIEVTAKVKGLSIGWHFDGINTKRKPQQYVVLLRKDEGTKPELLSRGEFKVIRQFVENYQPE